MIRFTKRVAKRTLIVGAALLAGGLMTFGGANEAEARGRCGYGGYGWGGYAPVYHAAYAPRGGFAYRSRGVVVARPYVPVHSYGAFYGGGYGRGFYGGRGVGIAIGF